MAVHVKKSELRRDRREKVVCFLLTLCGGVVVCVLGAPNKWLSAVGVTVAVFMAMISYHWRLWASARFWLVTAGLLLIHVVLMWVIFGLLLQRWNDVAFLVCIPGVFVECFFLYYVARFLLGERARTLEG